MIISYGRSHFCLQTVVAGFTPTKSNGFSGFSNNVRYSAEWRKSTECVEITRSSLESEILKRNCVPVNDFSVEHLKNMFVYFAKTLKVNDSYSLISSLPCGHVFLISLHELPHTDMIRLQLLHDCFVFNVEICYKYIICADNLI